jgi:Predicted AAA-ATPase/PD-(D/E)XK nuclease superfamily
LLSTIKELFQGSKELFEGLWIEDKWDWGKQNPVIHLSFAGTDMRELGLNIALYNMLDRVAQHFDITLNMQGNSSRLIEMLDKLNAKHGKVVVLIDEYDKAIIDYIDDIPRANENRDILRDFYIVLKDNPQYLKFVFITGISKFSKVSIFSALNHLNDITLNDQYAGIAGYTQHDLESHFEANIKEAALKNDMAVEELLAAMKTWYNGYSWNAKMFLYNPFSILRFFSENRFDNFWFSTGTPTLLAVLARQQQFYDLDEIETDISSIETFDVEQLDPQAVMFQTGYLTVKKYDRSSQIFTLSYPNYEVRKSFLAYMVSAYYDLRVNQVPPTVIKMQRAFERKDVATVIELTNFMFINIPSHIFDGTSEKYFHSLIHLLFHYLGMHIESEINTNKGRLDSVIQTPQYIYVLEFKFNKSAQIALDDIKKRGYLDKYQQSGKEIISVGINFSSDAKCIDDWLVA